MGAAAGAAAIGAVGAVGSSLIGGKGSGGGSSGSGQTSSTPWAPQQPYLQAGFQQASDIYNQDQAQGPYTGNFVAPNNPYQGSAIYNAQNYAGGYGANMPGQTGYTAANLQQAGQPYVQNAASMAANGAGPASPLAGILNGYATGRTPAINSLDPALTGALTTAGVNGANSLNDFTSGQKQVMDMSLADPTSGLINQAGEYMNSAPIQGAINSTNAQLQQQLHEQTVPGLNRQAEMGGSLNSSRAGMAEGMANEGEAIAQGNADSQIQNNAFNTGLSTAAAERNAGLTTGMYAANSGLVDNTNLAQGEQAAQTGQGEFGTTTALGAAGTGLNYSLGQQGLTANTELNANSQLGNATQMGINGGTAAGGQAALDFALGSGAGALQQQGDQANLTNSYDQWQMQQQQPWQNLDNYWNIVGKPEGTQGTTSQQQQTQLPPNLLGNAAGGAAAGAGLFNQFFPNNNAPGTSGGFNNGADLVNSDGSVVTPPAYVPPPSY